MSEGREDLGATLRGWALLDPPDGAPEVVVLAEAAGDDDLASALDGTRPRRFAGAWHEGVALGGEPVLVLRTADVRGGTRRVYVLREPSDRLREVVRFDHRVRLVPLGRGEALPTGDDLLGRLAGALEIRAFGEPA